MIQVLVHKKRYFPSRSYLGTCFEYKDEISIITLEDKGFGEEEGIVVSKKITEMRMNGNSEKDEGFRSL